MFQLRRILLSGLVALLMVGFVIAEEAGQAPEGNETERSYIGTWTGNRCIDSTEWKCLHLEITFIWEFPL